MKLRDDAKIFLHSLKVPTHEETFDNFIRKKDGAPGSRWCLDEALSPADLYVYLKARFGPPNGIMMILRSPSSDNFIQWHYTLKSGENYIQIMGMNTRTEFWISGYSGVSQEDWIALENAIREDFKNYGSGMTEVRNQLEKWIIFYNPYKRLENLVISYNKELTSLNLDSLILPKEVGAFPNLVKTDLNDPMSDLKEFEAQFSEISEKYARARELSICLRLLTPVWAESFVNLIIFILARPEFKNDLRIYNDFLRKEIDIRIKLLHVNCFGFKKPVDTLSQVFKDFQTLMNQRNDLIHGNVDPLKLGYETVFFDKTIPLFTESQGFFKNGILNSLIGIEPSESLRWVELVRSFMGLVTESLEDDIKNQIILLLQQRDLGWREATKRVGVLFPDYIMEGYAR
jgi:hypothetical protein